MRESEDNAAKGEHGETKRHHHWLILATKAISERQDEQDLHWAVRGGNAWHEWGGDFELANDKFERDIVESIDGQAAPKVTFEIK